MLKTIHVNGVPYVCWRKKSALDHSFLTFPENLHPTTPPVNDVDAIRAAAKSMKPIYAAVENMGGNDRWGDCTACAALKMQAIFDCAADGKNYRAPALYDFAWLYRQTTTPPFNPRTGENDNGTSLQAVLSFWQSHGLYEDGHGKIKAVYAVDATNRTEVEAALAQYGLLYAGCDLPKAWEQITGTGFTWGMSGPPDPNAGHCTFMYGHNETGVFDGSWGMEGTVPWDALAYYFGPAFGGELFAVAAA